MRKVLDALGRLHRSEKGAEGLEKLLIVAAIVLPLLGLMIYFRQTISEWVSGQWDVVAQDSANTVTTPNTGGTGGVSPSP